jgi:hypothetical protein
MQSRVLGIVDELRHAAGPREQAYSRAS